MRSDAQPRPIRDQADELSLIHGQLLAKRAAAQRLTSPYADCNLAAQCLGFIREYALWQLREIGFAHGKIASGSGLAERQRPRRHQVPVRHFDIGWQKNRPGGKCRRWQHGGVRSI